MPAFELAPIFGFEASPTCVGGGGTAGFFSRTTPNTPSRRGGARILKECAAQSYCARCIATVAHTGGP